MQLMAFALGIAAGALFVSCQTGVAYRGVNLAGAEFGETRLPGIHGNDYVYPDAKHGKRGFLGEFGARTSATCLAALDDMLAHVHANSDVWLGWTYWAAGPWWPSDYFTSLEPRNGADAPQMTPLARHL